MLDYTNLFECSGCKKFLPFGSTKCPYCGYDYKNPEKWEKEQRKINILVIIGILWVIFIQFFTFTGDKEDWVSIDTIVTTAKLFISATLPMALYIWYLKKRVNFFEKEAYKIELGEHYIQELEKKNESNDSDD